MLSIYSNFAVVVLKDVKVGGLMEKIKRSGAWGGLLALVTVLCLLVGGTGTAAAEPTQADRVPERIEGYTPGGFLPGADGKAVILGSVSATWPDGSYTDLVGATVSLYPHPTSKADRESGVVTPLAQTTTDEHGIYQFTMDASPSADRDFDIMIEYKGVKAFYGNDKDSASGTYIKPRMVVRPILTTEANFDKAGNIQGKLAEPKVLELKRDQLVHWDTYLLGRGTNLWNEKAPGFDVMPIEWWKNNSKAYGKLSSAFATHGAKITAVDGNGNPVDPSQITAKPGTYTVTYEIGFELPKTGNEPIASYLTDNKVGEFPGYTEFPAEGNRMVLGTASLTAKVPYKLSYNANGGEGTTPDEASFMKGASVTLANQGDLKKGKAEFLGWNTQADGKGTSYVAGQEVVFDADTTLYAQWKEAPVDNKTPGTSHSPKPAHKPSSRVQKKRVSKLPATGDNASYLAIALELFAGAGLATAGALMLRRREQL